MRPGSFVTCRSREVRNLVTLESKVEVASAIVLEGSPTPVVLVAVRFGDQAVLLPQEVDQVWSDTRVDLRGGQAIPATEV